MKMTHFERWFVNREMKANHNIVLAQHCLQQIDTQNIYNVLELGCGIGTTSSFLSKTYDMNVIGIDLDAEQIEIASKMQPKSNKLHFKEMDATQLEFDNESFDLVLTQNVFHHIPNWEKAIQEISRTLRYGAFLLWIDFTLLQIIKTICQSFVKNYGLYTLQEITDVFDKCHLQEHYHKKIPHGHILVFKNCQ